ncbi:MAG: LL-diaminopimelate aminotransferase [Candidatus Omnitrophota bacterium]|nr:LL-diaminopimelate aminotransferase [Candidatus Omnitrophota bacterium]
MNIEISERLKRLPPYLFVEIDRAKRQAKEQGRDIIDLGIGDPDRPTPRFIRDALSEAVKDPSTHRYALDGGLPELKEEIAVWYKNRFNVALNPENEILPLIGSKEGIAHMPLAFINPGDTALVPDPCYPPYKSGVIFCEGKIELLPLLAKNGFLPDINAISGPMAERAKIIYLNYPNNPTSACVDEGYFDDVARFASKNNIIVCHDAAYAELSYDGYEPASFLNAEGAREVGVEFHSLSKTFNMTGWRIGFVTGNKDIISAIGKVKSNIDSGIFTAIQRAGITALKNYNSYIGPVRDLYRERRDVLCDGLNSIGWRTDKPKAAFYAWIPCAKNFDSIKLAKYLLDKADIVVTPGVGFGKNGEGYVRIAFTVETERLKEAVARIKKVL